MQPSNEKAAARGKCVCMCWLIQAHFIQKRRDFWFLKKKNLISLHRIFTHSKPDLGLSARMRALQNQTHRRRSSERAPHNPVQFVERKNKKQRIRLNSFSEETFWLSLSQKKENIFARGRERDCLRPDLATTQLLPLLLRNVAALSLFRSQKANCRTVRSSLEFWRGFWRGNRKTKAI